MGKNIQIDELEELISNNSISKKVLLIDGQMPAVKNGKSYFYYSEDLKDFDAAPFGLARVGGYLDKHGIENKIIRLRDYYSSPEKLKELEEIIKEADVVGISGLSNSAAEMYRFCSEIKTKFPDKKIIGGREHFGLDYEWILNNQEKTGIDFCCTSQGELAMLSLALNIDPEKIGSIAFKNKEGEIVKNDYFPRLDEKEPREILRPQPAKEMPIEWHANIFPEFQKHFKHCGDTLVGTGCPFNCTFCANHKFMESRKYVPSPSVAKQEIEAMAEKGIDFFFVRDLLLNASEENLNKFLEFMTRLKANGKEMKWAAFASVIKNGDMNELFQKMEDAGCVEIMVGVEDVVGDRKNLKKGNNNDVAAEFIDSAKEHMLVRAFLILGLPEHYKYSREEIKNNSLKFMKEHPQAIYRMGLWTPIVGTTDFEQYESMLSENIRTNYDALDNFDTMHYVINPEKVYQNSEISEEKQWVKNPQDWELLRDEIIKEYYESDEHKEYLNRLKGKQLLFEAAKNFQEITLNRLTGAEKQNEFKMKLR